MAFKWSSVLTLVKAVYAALLRGKTIRVGGTDVVLPSEGNVPPLRGSKFDSKPAPFEPPNLAGKMK